MVRCVLCDGPSAVVALQEAFLCARCLGAIKAVGWQGKASRVSRTSWSRQPSQCLYFDTNVLSALLGSPQESVEHRFRRLAETWRRSTQATSSLSKIYFHPAYQQIIGLGSAALPYIFEELRREPDWWFWALSAITGADPVPEDASGDLERMTHAWLEWGTTRDAPSGA